jgi:hypothetical protein
MGNQLNNFPTISVKVPDMSGKSSFLLNIPPQSYIMNVSNQYCFGMNYFFL